MKGQRHHILLRQVLLACFFVAILPAVAANGAEVVRTENVTARLLTETSHAEPGALLYVGLELQVRDGWHTYWSNPGDSGEPTSMEWRLPDGVTAGAMQWPAPERVTVGPLVNFGYHGDVLHIIPLAVPLDWPADTPLLIEASARWLVCEEICIPEEGEFALQVPVSRADSGPHQARFDAARQRIPVPSPWPAHYLRDGNSIDLTMAFDLDGTRVTDAVFFPLSWGEVAPSARQSWRADAGGLHIALVAGDAPPTGTMSGVVVLTELAGGETLSRALSVSAEVFQPPQDDAAASPGVWAALGLALLGGLLLNLMPCVFPVLSLKAMEIVGLGDAERVAARRQGMAYAAGVLVFFAILGALLLLLRGSGDAVGWGFQLQWPPFVAAMVYLMFVLGLVMLGLVELAGSWLGAGDDLTRRHGWQGSFFTGALAALVATPCTAPFMGAALGFALTQPAPVALSIMLTLGAGLALPFLLLGFVPGVARVFPRPGAWMARLRGFLAFPLFATAVWLLWVLARQVDDNALGLVLAGMVALGWGLWMWRESRDAARRTSLGLRAGAAMLLMLSLWPVATIHGGGESSDAASGAIHEAYSPERLDQLRAAGQPVLVNLTAAWCITCQVNERVVLSSAAVIRALERYRVAYLKGDWTNREPKITALLTRYERAGVPLYLLFPAHGAEPRILPQILTENLVIDALAAAAAPAASLQTRLETYP